MATMYTRVRLGHDIIDITPSSRKFGQPTVHKDGARICAGSTGIRVSCGSQERSHRDDRQKAAKALRIAAPQALLLSADEVIEMERS